MQYQYTKHEYLRPLGLDQKEEPKEIIIVGAGPIGLALALELAQHGQASLILDDNNVVSVGSRAICWSKRSLEILDRLGLGDICLQKGVTWKIGRTYHGENEVFNFDLLPEEGHKMPAFVNLQQYYVEEFLLERCLNHPLIEIRFKNKLQDLQNSDEKALIEIETPDGPYSLETRYLIACDGARSPIRELLDLDFEGELFEERFLIADIEMTADFPSERRFWFEPRFHEGQSALLHKQPDDIYRIDLQLGWDADPEEERKPEKIIPRITKMVGHSNFKLDWSSIYTFQCRRLERFVHGAVVFAGDSAHIVSPFGARGGNGGLQDVDALGWRLACVVQGKAPKQLLQKYNEERVYASDENLLNSSRATRFMSPSEGAERWFRDATLQLAEHVEFARPMVNSGRLSRPATYPICAPDSNNMPYTSRPGSVAPDAPIGNTWLLSELGQDMVALFIGCDALPNLDIRFLAIEANAFVQNRYLGDCDQAIYLIRPDQIIAARWETTTDLMINEQVRAILEGNA